MRLEGSSKDGSGPSRSPQPPTSPVPADTSQRTKSPAPTLAMNGLEAPSAEDPSEDPSEEAPGLSRKRVANAVRKVVSRVLPGEEPGSSRETLSRGVKSPEHPARGKKGEKAASGPKPPPPPPPPPPAPSKPEAKKEATKDELSMGLRSLMSRGRGKDHKPRSRQSPGKGEKASSQEPGSSGKPGSLAKPGSPENQCPPAPPEELADPGSAGPKANLTGLQHSKSPAPDVQQEVPECVTNLPCPSPPSLEGQAPSQPSSPSLLYSPA
ncbi:collagen alpha-1(XVI) chain-like isoform X2 [Rhinolophus ferrumequinum]|uniref:collagen alpha-1(XVI) chain-like isoform X2 n=1 Tax=Rhinolophus ferrumequinum TaxID=59479 RepID=UPI00140FE459|nr:collagen alpha-1(XVI) chain-like isoform X2 [Rhinolophus ferrumequinum]